MMKCPYCDKETDEQVKICPNCKAAIPDKKQDVEEPSTGNNRRNKKESE